MADDIADKLAVEEFKQIYELSRQREVAMSQILTVTTTGTTTFLAAAAAFVFQWSQKGHLIYCYLLIVPMPFLISMLRILTSHRIDMYRFGYYLTVFFEERYGGSEWGVRSFRFREIRKGESQDAVTLVFWSLFTVSSILFVAALSIYDARIFLNALVLIPLAVGMAYQNNKFHQDLRPIKDVWLEVLKEQGRIIKKPDTDR